MTDEELTALFNEVDSIFFDDYLNDKTIKYVNDLISEGFHVTYDDAYQYAERVGELSGKAFRKVFMNEDLPDGFTDEIIEKVIKPRVEMDHSIVHDMVDAVQRSLNEEAGLSIKAQEAQLRGVKLNSMLNNLTSSEDFDLGLKHFESELVDFTMSVVDDSIEENIRAQYDAGLEPTITRTAVGAKPCKWCQNLAGTYVYSYRTPTDIFRRHDNCRCTLTFIPASGRKQNAWSKKYMQ